MLVTLLHLVGVRSQECSDACGRSVPTDGKPHRCELDALDVAKRIRLQMDAAQRFATDYPRIIGRAPWFNR